MTNMQFLKDFLELFFPKICINCQKALVKNENVLCNLCNHTLPIIFINDYKKNEITDLFYGRLKLSKAASFLYYTKGGITQTLIHELKYNNREDIGTFLGNIFGYQLRNNHFFDTIDYILPVPINRKKKKIRGYNQVTTFGKALSYNTDIPFISNVLISNLPTKSQTLKTRLNRFSNVDTKFNLLDLNYFKNKHILLIDDVITSGATIEACCKELLKTENIKISIATIAYTQKT